MKPTIFKYLKNKRLTDIDLVNKLFISAYLRHHRLIPIRNSILIGCYIKEGSKYDALLNELILQLDLCGCQYSLEDLNKLFEFVLSPEDRKITGAIYTPEYIRDRIVDEVFAGYVGDLNKVRAADIACGCGGFLLTVATYLLKKTKKKVREIIQENIFGLDIQSYSVERTKLLLSLFALERGEDEELSFNLWEGDALCFDFSMMGDLDVIVGNPPYVRARNMSDESRQLLKKWPVCASGNSDLYIPFFQIAVENLKERGRVGFITMNSFLTSLNGRALRNYFSEKSYQIAIVDFRGIQLFPGNNTYTCLFFLRKTKSRDISYCVNDSKKLPSKFKFRLFPYSELENKSGWKLNQHDVVHGQEKIGIPLGEFCASRHGIATLSNKTYVFKPATELDNFFIFIKNEKEIKIEKGICRRIVNSNKLNSGARIADVIEYVIFPYRRNNKGFIELIPEGEMRDCFPLTYEYLKESFEVLKRRDKGKTDDYPAWYAFGRTQSLQMPRYKLFFPKIADKPINCELVDDQELLLYNGMAFVSDDIVTVKILKAILESELFWRYVVLNSKPYSSGYYSLTGNNIKHFGIPIFNEKEICQLLKLKNRRTINNWLRSFYNLKNEEITD